MVRADSSSLILFLFTVSYASFQSDVVAPIRPESIVRDGSQAKSTPEADLEMTPALYNAFGNNAYELFGKSSIYLPAPIRRSAWGVFGNPARLHSRESPTVPACVGMRLE